MHKPWMISRRSFLRAAGVTIGLPALDAMWPNQAQAQTVAPRRLLFFYVPCGIHMQTWTPPKKARVGP